MSGTLSLEAMIFEFYHSNKYRVREVSVKTDSGTVHNITALVPEITGDRVEIFRWFRSAFDSIYSCKQPTALLNDAIDVFKVHSNVLTPAVKEYILLDGIIKSSFYLQIKDGNLMTRIFNLIYDCWKSFGPLHFRAILKPCYLKKDMVEKHELAGRIAKKYMSFFLNHARKQKIVFDGYRMIDHSMYSSEFKPPIMVAAEVWSSRAVLKYLQYGAKLENVYISPSRSRNGVSSALIEVIRSLMYHIYYRYLMVHPERRLTNAEVDALHQLDRFDQEIIRILRYILRAVKKLDRDSLDFQMRIFVEMEHVIFVPSADVISHGVMKTLLPCLEKRLGTPMELKHACRCTIREQLNNNWQLPAGIKKLPLPKPLKRFLNLLAD